MGYIAVDEMRAPISQAVQTDIPNLVGCEQNYRKLPIVASSDINSPRPNRIPVSHQDKRLCTQQVLTTLLAAVQARWLAWTVDVNSSRTISIRLNGLFYKCLNWFGHQLFQEM